MGSYRFALSFRVNHPTADLSDLPARLGLPSSRSWTAGAPRQTAKGRPLSGRHDASYCCMTIAASDEADLPELLDATLTRLRAHADVLESLASTGGAFNFFVGWFSDWNSGDSLDWRLLGAMAEMRISLDLDIYGPERPTNDAGT